MADRHQISCIVPDGADADQRIDAVGGVTGTRWQLSIDDAIAGVESGKWSFWTTANGKSVDVVVAKRPSGRKYLKTTADSYEPNNLLALDRCP